MWMGVDGGGSSLRVAIVDDALNVLALHRGDSANPSALGHEAAAERIRTLVRAALGTASLDDVDGVGIGIAGASNEYASDWLNEVLRPILPAAQIVPSSDVEIALVGGRGRLDGIVLLSGTGSIAYGVNPTGQKKRVGGWGYRLGDEGSGYWIGLEALKTVTQFSDGWPLMSDQLPRAMMSEIGITNPLNVIEWTYHKAENRDIAALAKIVLDLAGDPLADDVINRAAEHLANHARHLQNALGMSEESIVFAGSLLTNGNALQRAVYEKLNLSTPPLPKHENVIGGALLAKLKQETTTND